MPSTTPRRQITEAFAEVARALGNPNRLELLEQLAQGERSVEGLAERCGLTVANASQHLQALRRAGLVEGRRAGKQILYNLTGEHVLALLAALRVSAEQAQARVRQLAEDYFAHRDALQPVGLQELARRLADGLVTVVDVRPPDEFAAGHLPQAVNVPMSELAQRLADLPHDTPVVAYCRGPWCVLAFEAVAQLRAGGFDARRMDGGLPEWRLAGLPVERSL